MTRPADPRPPGPPARARAPAAGWCRVLRPHAGQGVGRQHLLDGRAGRVLAGAVAAAAVPGPARLAGLRGRLVRAGDRRHRRGQDRRVRPAGLHPGGRGPAHRPDGARASSPAAVPTSSRSGSSSRCGRGRRRSRRWSTRSPRRTASTGVRHPVWQRLFSLLIYLSALVVGGVHAAAGRAGPGPAAPAAARAVARGRRRGRRDVLLPGRRAAAGAGAHDRLPGRAAAQPAVAAPAARGACWRCWCSSPRRRGCASTSPC